MAAQQQQGQQGQGGNNGGPVAKPAEQLPPICVVGSTVVKGRWRIIQKIGQGAFGEIYSAKNIYSSEMVAIKAERVDSKKQVLKLEVAVLRKLQGTGSVARFITCGRHNDFNYMVMELLGTNLSDQRRRFGSPEGRLSMVVTMKLSLQMLDAIEVVHKAGYLHRDIKPSNFVMGTGEHRTKVFMIDFGLARRYLLPNGEIREPRECAGFRGTARYASINSHQSKDLGRVDDLWSLIYIIIEFCNGTLPWRRLKDKEQIGEHKMKMNDPSLVDGMPPQMLTFMEHLQKQGYADKPDYAMIKTLISEMIEMYGENPETPLDWDSLANNAALLQREAAIRKGAVVVDGGRTTNDKAGGGGAASTDAAAGPDDGKENVKGDGDGAKDGGGGGGGGKKKDGLGRVASLDDVNGAASSTGDVYHSQPAVTGSLINKGSVMAKRKAGDDDEASMPLDEGVVPGQVSSDGGQDKMVARGGRAKGSGSGGVREADVSEGEGGGDGDADARGKGGLRGSTSFGASTGSSPRKHAIKKEQQAGSGHGGGDDKGDEGGGSSTRKDDGASAHKGGDAAGAGGGAGGGGAGGAGGDAAVVDQGAQGGGVKNDGKGKGKGKGKGGAGGADGKDGKAKRKTCQCAIM